MGPDASAAKTTIEDTDLPFLTHREAIADDPIRARDVILQIAVDHGLLSLARSAVDTPLRLSLGRRRSK
jgi:hypothetical protein